MNHIAWLVEKILDFDPSLWTLSVEDHPDLTIDQWLAIRIKWGIDRGFVWFEFDRHNEPKKAICMRPVNEEILERIQADFSRSVWDFDPAGKIVFIDFRCGDGSIPLAWDLCKMSGRNEVAYYHHQKIKRVKLSNVPRVAELLHGPN
jgi:hypothetical protein